MPSKCKVVLLTGDEKKGAVKCYKCGKKEKKSKEKNRKEKKPVKINLLNAIVVFSYS